MCNLHRNQSALSYYAMLQWSSGLGLEKREYEAKAYVTTLYPGAQGRRSKNKAE